MMAGVNRVAEKVPGWVERMLVPTLESRVRGIVREEVGYLEKTMNAKFDAVEKTMNARFDAVNGRIDSLELSVNTRFDSLEERIPMIQDIAGS